MEITPDRRPVTRRDLTIQESVLRQRVRLLPGTITRTGTPLTFDKNAWRTTREGEVPLMFAAGPADEEYVTAYRSLIVETHTPNGLQVGRVSISDVTDRGVVTFTNDPEGRYLALTDTRVLLT